MQWIRLVAILVFVIVLMGCQAAGHPFESVNTLASEAVIYVYREDPFAGATMTPEILVDRRSIGTLLNNGYLYKVVQPGRHVVSCRAMTEQTLEIQAAAGRSYYLEAAATDGFWMGQPTLTPVGEGAGSALVSRKKYSAPAGATETASSR